MENAGGDLARGCQQDPTGMHLRCSRSDGNKEEGRVESLNNVAEMDPQTSEYPSVIGRIVKGDGKNVEHAIRIQLVNSVHRFLSEALCIWGIEKKDMLERASSQQGQDWPRLFLLVDQSFEIRIMKTCECQQDIHCILLC